MMQFTWSDLIQGAPTVADGSTVQIDGFASSACGNPEARYVLLGPEPQCCFGCLPIDPDACLEVFCRGPVPLDGRAVTLRGRFRRLSLDPCGWRYRLEDARLIAPAVTTPRPRLSRRALAAGLPFLCLPVGTVRAEGAAAPPVTESARKRAEALLTARIGVDCHSHGGRVLRVDHDGGRAAFAPLAEQMRYGRLAIASLAITSDSPTYRIDPDGRIRAFRDPAPGELAAYADRGFRRLHALVRDQGLRVIRSRADLSAAHPDTPSIIVAAEGGDFLEGLADNLEKAYRQAALRHLQLTHYRANAIGDIQTAPAIHGGLTSFGAEIIRLCETLGIIVDVAHGTEALVRQAAAVASKPLVLSHTSLTSHPRRSSRLISADHARIIAQTGGVIGIWPPASVFPDLEALADGIAHMAEVVGPAHVGIGTDLMGIVGASVLPDYDRWPELAALLLRRFDDDEAAGILGGNYLRVARACLSALP